jgi:uncharacterized repeat protein (TIGR03837 family)
MPTMRWDLFCRVIDNFGDIGVCWRLAADLGARGEQVRLWVDDASALAWMAPRRSQRTVAPGTAAGRAGGGAAELADVVVEAFGCDPPPAFVARMARRETPPVWINLEYLSAEPYVERSHGLPFAATGRAGARPAQVVLLPRLHAGSGGLLREPGLMRERRPLRRPPGCARAASIRRRRARGQPVLLSRRTRCRRWRSGWTRRRPCCCTRKA